MGALFLFVCFVALVAVLAWNFIPDLRQKLKGWSTVAEAALGTALTYFGLFSEGIQEAFKAGYIPKEFVVFVPGIICAWIILKRIQTKAPVGKKL